MATHLERIAELLGRAYVRDGVDSDAVDGIIPQVVASPRSADALSELLAFANSEGLAVAPRGGGTQMAMGNRARRLDVVADMSEMDSVVEHNHADLTLVVQAGITLSALRNVLSEERQLLPLDAPLPNKATIGGTLAAGVSGPLKWQYGSARDLVIGMKAVQADGRLVKSGGNVVKNVSGYDMARLHVGGLGTLGVITEVSFKLTPMPRRESTLLAQFNTVADCMSAALGIFNSGVMPIALTAFNRAAAARMAMDDYADGASGSAYTLAVRLGSRPRTLRRMESEALAVIERRAQVAHAESLGAESSALWATLADFGHADGEDPALSARIAVLPTEVARAMDALERIGDAAIAAHPGYGMINAHWFDTNADLTAYVQNARQAIHELGGSLIVERAPLAVKDGIDVWDYTGASIEVMRRLKAQYDANGILNPNRFTGGI